MKLLLVRHGETHFNAEHRYLGALDPELNAKGLSQARDLHSVLPVNLDAIVCSPLRRARQTAEILCRSRGFTPKLNDAFRERNVGVFEGLTQEEARIQFPVRAVRVLLVQCSGPAYQVPEYPHPLGFRFAE